MSSFENLTKLAADIGADIRLVQGAGGNVSFKDRDTMWVKASGTWMADAHKRMIFVPLDLSVARSALDSGSDDFSVAIKNNSSGLRPSIETSLHVLMPHSVVVHVHSVNALSWAVRHDGKFAVAEKLNGLAWAWVDYVRPGLPLTRSVANALAANPDACLLLLANHGIVVAADTTKAARDLLSEVESRLQTHSPGRVSDITFSNIQIPHGCRLPANMLIHQLAHVPSYFHLLEGALYPDHALFLGTSIPILEAEIKGDIVGVLKTYPYCAALAGEGFILGEKCSAGAEAMLECLALLAPCLPERDKLRFLNSKEVAEISNWDAEKARLNINRSA